ncbi:MAG: methyltransferase type 11 [Gemmatimonadaceae bacterium]|nr:methyltransferase type 11 [Acetobacteraceae bacterium]
MQPYPDLPPDAFAKADPSPDTRFYAQARMVAHIDDAAIDAVTDLYRQHLPPGGTVFDMQSSWISHLPPEAVYDEVIGHGMNATELAANPRLDRWFVQDLNADPTLPLSPGSLDAACCCVSVQYLQRPAEVFGSLVGCLRPGAPVIVTFSNRCFPTKAVAIWQALSGPDQCRLVAMYLRQAGFERIAASAPRDGRRSDPLWAVLGHAPGG